MCFLCGKGDRNIQFIEISENDPYILEGLKYSGDQTKGACLVPKRAMDVMQGEVNRVLQLCDSSIVPVTWQVPRKVSGCLSDLVSLYEEHICQCFSHIANTMPIFIPKPLVWSLPWDQRIGFRDRIT